MRGDGIGPLRASLAAAALFAAGCALLGPRPVPEAELAALVARAEAARSLRFPGRLDARFVASEDVERVLAHELDAGFGREQFARAEALAAALGILPPGTDLRSALVDLQARAVAGFYAPLRRRLYVVYDGPRAAALGPATEGIVVHEIVHALQHAHGKLLDVLLGLDDHDDLAFALGALLEGDAVWAAFRDAETREGVTPTPPAELAESFRTGFDSPATAGLARYLRDSFLLQYPAGYALAHALATRGGTAALDAALRDPPLSSEEVLHPEGYLGERPREPLPFLALEAEALDGEGCRALGSNTFGELGLRAFAVGRGAGEARALSAAAGWDGDRAVGLACGGELRFAWLVQLDTELDAVELASLAASTGDAGTSVEREGRRVLLSRGLAPAARRACLGAPSLAYPHLDAYLADRPQVLARAR